MTAPNMIAADRILEQFRNFGTIHSGTTLAINLGIPYSTVRRAIQDLRRDGFVVPYRRDIMAYSFEGVVGN